MSNFGWDIVEGIALLALTVAFYVFMAKAARKAAAINEHLSEISNDAAAMVINIEKSFRECDIVALRNRVDEANRQLRDEIRLRISDNAQAAARIQHLEERLQNAIQETGRTWE